MINKSTDSTLDRKTFLHIDGFLEEYGEFDDRLDMARMFCEEARRTVDRVSRLMTNEQFDPITCQQIRRAIHRVKGNAGVVGATNLFDVSKQCLKSHDAEMMLNISKWIVTVNKTCKEYQLYCSVLGGKIVKT